MTIVDIAKESGYSVSTVSRVLNGRKDVSPEAKRRIMEIVEAHNFVPNNNAKHLKQTISQNIAVVVKGTSNLLFADIIEAIQRRVETSDYAVEVYYFDEEMNEVEEAIRLSRERKPRGILFLGGNPVNFRNDFEKVKIPCVLVTNRGDGLGFKNLGSVATDDFAAAEQLTDYLISFGHRNIAVIGGDTEISHTSKQRFEGYATSMQKHGMNADPQYLEKTRFTFQGAYNAMIRILDRNLPLTAVFAMSDVMAVGAARAICDRGLRIPEDISLVGFDGTPLADYYNPKIVTIRQSYLQIASESVDALFRMIESGAAAEHELLSFTLQNTESVKKL